MVLALAPQIDEAKTAERLGAILETTTDYVIIAEPDGRALYVNSAARQALGIGDSEDIRYLSVLDFHPDWAQTLLAHTAIPMALREGAWIGETALQSRDGREIPVSHLLLSHKRSDGSVDFLSSVARNVSERKYFEAQLVYAAGHDALTGLYNRRRFEEEIDRELVRARHCHTAGALLFLDLDGFKSVNDCLGHRAGDELLIGLAGALRACLRKTDMLARLGGDEFAVLLPETSLAEAQAVASCLLETVRRHTLLVGGHTVHMTASLGIALYPTHGATVDKLLVCADLAMYQAKGHRDHLCIYDSTLQVVATERHTSEHRLRAAIDDERLLLYLQPIRDLTSGAVHYEVLLRVQGEAGEILSPASFLKTAEQTGLIRTVDRWVVRQSIQLIAAQAQRGEDLRLAVNLSGSAVGDSELLRLIQAELTSTGIDPSSLIFEITETAAVADLHEAQTFIRTLKSLGCGFAIDDFGVGFSSFAYLKDLPADYLKIDGSFIRNLRHDPVDQELVRAIVRVAQALGKRTVAEFVEDETTMRLLRTYGVDCIQGFYEGRPGPVCHMLPGRVLL